MVKVINVVNNWLSLFTITLSRSSLATAWYLFVYTEVKTFQIYQVMIIFKAIFTDIYTNEYDLINNAFW